MSFDAQRLLDLLPTVYRLRDAALAARTPDRLSVTEEAELALLEAAGDSVDPVQRRRRDALRAQRDRGPLATLLAVFAEQIAVLEENLEQLYDDQFVETCAAWAVPYLGDLIGYRLLHGKARRVGSRRAEVAHTIAFRRRKGTASMLEQLARDVTGWNARVVEFFELLATTQYMNHVRLANRVAPSLRDADAMAWIGTAFDGVPRTLDVRRIESRRGRYNIPNVGIFLWRIEAHRLERSPAVPHPGDATGRKFRFGPLGADVRLHTRPEAEDEISHLAEPINVPALIGRRLMHRHLARYYGERKSIAVFFDGVPVPLAQIDVCNLADDGADWAHDAPPGKVAIDPELGRLVLAADVVLPAVLEVTHHYGAPGELGGGEYPRENALAPAPAQVIRVPNDHATIQAALGALGGAGVVEITDNGSYVEALQIDVTADQVIELRAMTGKRPLVALTAPMTLRGGNGAGVIVNGLVIAGDTLVVPATGNALRTVRIVHSTLVPGRALAVDGAPVTPGATSLEVARPDVEVALDRSILGALRVDSGASARVTDCVIDAGAPGAIAYAALGGVDPDPGGALALESSTVIGEVRCASLYASNAILLGGATVVRRQEGCVRFSFLPLDAAAPRRFRCQPTPEAGSNNFPRFTSLRYGVPGYCQLAPRTPEAIRRGAEDESEMGVFRFLYQPQRETDLVTRLDEYLRVGLRAGVFYES